MKSKPRDESPTDIAILINDEELFRLVAVWTKMNAEQRKNTRTIAAVANISPSRTDDAVLRAKVNHLIYDDGTVNEHAQKWINTATIARVMKATKDTTTNGTRKAPKRSAGAKAQD